MDNAAENHQFDVNNLLNNVNVDPVLAAAEAEANDERNEINNEDRVNEQQLGIQDLLQQLNALTQSLEARDADLQRRLNSLEQNSSRGSTISTASSTGSRPLNDRFGLNHDQNGGNSSSNNAPVSGNSPPRPNEIAPSAIVPNPSGRGRASRHQEKTLDLFNYFPNLEI